MTREQLLKQLEKTWLAFKQSYAGLSDSQLVEPGVTGTWSVRDILAHISTWEEEALKHCASQSAAPKPYDPPPTDNVKVLSGADVRAAFEKGTPLVDKNGHNYWVLAGRRDKAGQAELHEKDLDIFYILQGSATFITGGKMVDGKATAPGEVRGSGIEGGEAHTLSKDDVVIIPPGVPHWFKDVQDFFSTMS